MEKRAVEELVITEDEYNKIVSYLDDTIKKFYLQFEKEYADVFSYKHRILRIMIKLAWYKAFRIMEILQLKVRDVIFIERHNQIEFRIRRKKRHSKERYRFSILTPWEDIKDLIERYGLQPDSYLFSRREVDYKKPLVDRTASKLISEILRKVGIKRTGLAWHGFRRGRASQLCNHGANICDIQSLLNHKREDITKLYLQESCEIVRLCDDRDYAHL